MNIIVIIFIVFILVSVLAYLAEERCPRCHNGRMIAWSDKKSYCDNEECGYVE